MADFMTRFSPGNRALINVAGVGLASVLMVPLTFLTIVGAVAFPSLAGLRLFAGRGLGGIGHRLHRRGG
ncbi:MAG: hypothetical protein R6V60_02210 [Desulfobacterales bacterium]